LKGEYERIEEKIIGEELSKTITDMLSPVSIKFIFIFIFI
jgi:hypothetical protein